MSLLTHAEFHFHRLMVTLIFGIRASEPPPPGAWRTTEKVGLNQENIRIFYSNKRIRLTEKTFPVPSARIFGLT